MDARTLPDDSTDADLAAAILQNRQLRRALETRLLIGQAQGILMERLKVDADAAFQFLRRAASTNERKLHLVAEEIVATRSLPRL